MKKKHIEQETTPVSKEQASKEEMLKVTFSQIDKQFGKGSVMMLGSVPHEEFPVISTGSLLVDDVIGIGGVPRGRIIEIYGPEASGKSTLAMQIIAQAQQRGGICAYIDAEHALDPKYAAQLGINIDELIISQPDYGEQGLDIAEMLVRSGAIDIVVVDSVAALVPKAELEGDMGDAHVGLQARLMSQALRKLTSVVHKSKTVFIFINQIRQKIGGMAFASNETTSGGNALKFYASLRLDVRRIAALRKNERHFGNRVIVKVVKNKMAPPFRTVEVDLIFGHGISRELDLLDAGILYKVINQSGSWFAYNNQKIAQGREQVHDYLKSNPEVAEAMRADVVAAMALAKKNATPLAVPVSHDDDQDEE